jgi:membrane-bound lytic murein transglycosylase B
MTLPFDVKQAAWATRKEARKLFARGNPVNHTKTQDFRQKSGNFMLKEHMRHFLRLFAAGSLLVLAACAGRHHPPVPAAAPTLRAPTQAPAQAPSLAPLNDLDKFQAFIRDFETTALANGITAETYSKAMTGIAPITTINTIIAEQPEFVRAGWS